MPIAIKIINAIMEPIRLSIETMLIEPIDLFIIAAMFGMTNADNRKYIPRKNMKFPKTIG